MSTIELPVKLGDKIYIVPSEENFLINALFHKERNKIYEFTVNEIRYNRYGFAVVCYVDRLPFFFYEDDYKYRCKAYETERFYGETWFTQRVDAENKLKWLNKNCSSPSKKKEEINL